MLDFLRDLFGSGDESDDDSADAVYHDGYSDGFEDGYGAGADIFQEYLDSQEKE